MRSLCWLAAAAALVPSAPRVAFADDGVGIDPTKPYASGAESDEEDQQEGWRFRFQGYLRVPGRVSIGGDHLHSPPRVPDEAYTDWRYTNNVPSPWTEVVLSYGNARVTGTVVLASYNITDAGYKDTQAQLGINESFLTIRAPTAFGARGGLVWNVGAFSNRYGAAGRYDAGRYDTYLFGATHVAGETLASSFRLGNDWVGIAEHGVGAKIDVAPVLNLDSLDPELGNNLGNVLPYGGDVQQGSTLLHHAHFGVVWKHQLVAAAHYLTEWTDDADANAGETDGRITTLGGELKLIGSRFGDGYLGYAYLRSRSPLRLAGALETLHSFEGWNLRDNFFDPDHTGSGTGTGDIHTVLFQYTFSLATYLWHPQEFYGQAADLTFSVFGMYNHVIGKDGTFPGSKSRLKAGADVTYYTPLPWLGAQLRYDSVQPDMDDNTQSFHVITPKLILKTEFSSHEEVYIQYSRYFYGDSVRPGYPHEAANPDKGVFAVTATMWW